MNRDYFFAKAMLSLFAGGVLGLTLNHKNIRTARKNMEKDIKQTEHRMDSLYRIQQVYERFLPYSTQNDFYEYKRLGHEIDSCGEQISKLRARYDSTISLSEYFIYMMQKRRDK